MKKGCLVFISFFSIILFWYGESRKFICLGNDTCLTVWKTFGNTCYIIPVRYYGLIGPSIDHLRTKNTAQVDLYFPKSQPKTILVRATDSIVIKNKHPEIWRFVNLLDDVNSNMHLLYEDVAKNRLKEDVDFIFIDIHDSYSVDKYRNRLW